MVNLSDKDIMNILELYECAHRARQSWQHGAMLSPDAVLGNDDEAISGQLGNALKSMGHFNVRLPSLDARFTI